MPVLGLISVTLEVPDLEEGRLFYTDAGLVAKREGNVLKLSCKGQTKSSIILIGGASQKKLHHITLRAEALEQIANKVPTYGGRVTSAPSGLDNVGLWVQGPHGMLIHLVEDPGENDLPKGDKFEVNAPGRLVRKGRSGIRPRSSYSDVNPLKLGHVLLFTPDTMKSVEFVTKALGMGLADHAQDVVAFCCVKTKSDHHIVAFGKSEGIGFHHASFQVNDPDEVGRAGHELSTKTKKGDWGFGRHTIGSNFFHYIQDPWGSWFEYYSDMDYIEDHDLWITTNYEMADSMVNWGPELPDDFVFNYEVNDAT